MSDQKAPIPEDLQEKHYLANLCLSAGYFSNLVVSNLIERIARLEADNRQLREENARLGDQEQANIQLSQNCSGLRDEVATLKEKVARLETPVSDAEQKKYGYLDGAIQVITSENVPKLIAARSADPAPKEQP